MRLSSLFGSVYAIIADMKLSVNFQHNQKEKNMYKKKKLLIAIAGLAMVGCASVSHIPMTPETANTIKNREVATVKRDKPNFAAATVGQSTFGIFGIAAATSAGNEIVTKNNIEDPAIYIGERLSEELAKKYDTKVSSKSIEIGDDNVKHISKSSPGSELVLDIMTINWNFVYFPTSFNKYRVIYRARLRLIDTKSEKVLAEGICSRVPDQTPDSPTYDELLANNAERLKKELKDAADFCVGEFKSKVLQF